MHREYAGHKIIAFISSTGAAAITLTDLELIFRTVGAGLGCLIALVTLADMAVKRWRKLRGE